MLAFSVACNCDCNSFSVERLFLVSVFVPFAAADFSTGLVDVDFELVVSLVKPLLLSLSLSALEAFLAAIVTKHLGFAASQQKVESRRERIDKQQQQRESYGEITFTMA